MKRLAAVACLIAAVGVTACSDEGGTATDQPRASESTGLERLAELAGARDRPLRSEIRRAEFPFGFPAEAGLRRILVGRSVTHAEAATERVGWTLRVVRRDGVHLAYTGDYQQNRVNVAVRHGEITRVIGVF